VTSNSSRSHGVMVRTPRARTRRGRGRARVDRGRRAWACEDNPEGVALSASASRIDRAHRSGRGPLDDAGRPGRADVARWCGLRNNPSGVATDRVRSTSRRRQPGKAACGQEAFLVFPSFVHEGIEEGIMARKKNPKATSSRSKVDASTSGHTSPEPAMDAPMEVRATSTLMGAVCLPAPGQACGPCAQACEHRQCVAVRALAERACPNTKKAAISGWPPSNWARRSMAAK